MSSNTLKEYKNFIVAHLRELEISRARGDAQALRHLELVGDNELLKKWAWVVSICGCVVCFGILPFAFSFFALFIPSIIMELFWMVLKFAMGSVVIILGLAVYFTAIKNS